MNGGGDVPTMYGYSDFVPRHSAQLRSDQLYALLRDKRAIVSFLQPKKIVLFCVQILLINNTEKVLERSITIAYNKQVIQNKHTHWHGSGIWLYLLFLNYKHQNMRNYDFDNRSDRFIPDDDAIERLSTNDDTALIATD